MVCYDPSIALPEELAMPDTSPIDRRTMMKAAGALGALAAVRPAFAATDASKGHIKQSVCRWCYSRIPLETLAEEAAKMGYKSIELLNQKEVQTVKKLGLTCAMLSSPSSKIENCLNRVENHDFIEKDLHNSIDFAAAEALPNVICFSGNRKGMPDDEGMKNCAKGLKRIVGYAEEKKVTLCMELLNSKVNHKDYMCDHTEWGVGLCKMVGSPRFKLLYDIYHMQIMEGDVIRTIKQHKEWLGHYHTGGNPGRNEIDETQELNYPAIMKALIEIDYQGYVGQEFIPKREPLASLAQGFRICDV
jgi:hydroxypyruvate isomerase